MTGRKGIATRARKGRELQKAQEGCGLERERWAESGPLNLSQEHGKYTASPRGERC